MSRPTAPSVAVHATGLQDPAAALVATGVLVTTGAAALAVARRRTRRN